MLVKVLIAGAGAGFVLAIVGSFTGVIAGISPEGFSRACTNLALIAIALSVASGRPNHKPPAS